MGSAYEEVLLRADDPNAITTAQRQWLKMRNTCHDEACIKRAYEARFVTLHDGSIRPPTKVVPSRGETLESHRFPREADKLKSIQEVLRARKLFPAVLLDDSYCTQFMRDLLDGKVTAVEPDVYALSVYDPRLMKLRRCEEKELREVQVDHPDQFFSHATLLGGPPYRYYRIDLDGNPANGKEDLLYHEGGKFHPHTGYSWVDLDACRIRDTAPMGSMFIYKSAPPNFFRLNLIVQHKGEFLALEMFANTTDPEISNYNFKLTNFKDISSRRICSWREPTIETTPPRVGGKRLKKMTSKEND